ncbi:MAG: S8 family serine peptidase, partial [Bryobacteraceae bacterium]|nr:S8 family serine peptidase [Bryobacteraceae bacterium]
MVVRLSDPPLALVAGNKRTGLRMTTALQQAYVQQLRAKQTALMSQIAAQGGLEEGRLTKASNALVVSIDRSKLKVLQGIPGVASVRGLLNYSLALSSVVPYVGATAVQTMGITGGGITVAVLDSGIDYTHKNLGGAGTTAAYVAAYGANPEAAQNKTRDGLFPTAKVINGFDFVGESWPVGDLADDPDPIDLEGHGTHVADIIAGKSLDGTHKGVAPDAKLIAVKVCSAVATNCSGLALLRGVDFALDPNGDGNIADAVDVMNLSVGSDFGTREDDLTEALRIATKLGVVVVAAAGNGGNIPYIAGSPATGPSIISVAETQVPTATTYSLLVTAPASIAGTYTNTATLEFAPIGSGFSNGPVVFVGRGCPADPPAGFPADPYLTNPAGKVALIDRGACNISDKVDRAAKAGAIGVLIGLVAPGDAVSFSRGGGDTFVPSLVITQGTANLIKSRLTEGATVLATVSPAQLFPLNQSMVSSSSRGPGYSYGSIKPDLGAPGASLSAQAGTGSSETIFGGTSGAAPVVTGAAALLLQTCPTC